MKVIYCLLLFTTFACQSNQSDNKDKPNAYRDLLVDRVVWKKTEAIKPREAPTNRYWFTITNSSESYSYKRIEVQFDYFDSTYHKISSSKQIIDKAIGPRAALSIGEVQDGFVKPAAKTSTVTIVKAESSKTLPE